jgi:hypothetical protein
VNEKDAIIELTSADGFAVIEGAAGAVVSTVQEYVLASLVNPDIALV